jgi:aldose 1-epimerase
MSRVDPAMPCARRIVLSSGDARLEASPADGGTLARWSVSGIDLLRRQPPGAEGPLQSACFPLAPFSNLVSGGGFYFDGRFHPLARNHPQEPAPIHGDAWLAPWRVDELAGSSVLMSYAHAATAGFPLRYGISQKLMLARRSLTILIRLTNMDERVMPAGLGLHPYFRRLPGTRLEANHTGRWDEASEAPNSRFSVPEEIGEETVDACYTGWSGTARVYWPHDEVVVTIRARAPACALVVYSPAGSDFVCLEPVTHVNDGFNAFAAGAIDTGVRTLQPGEEMSLRTVLSVTVRTHRPPP